MWKTFLRIQKYGIQRGETQAHHERRALGIDRFEPIIERRDGDLQKSRTEAAVPLVKHVAQILLHEFQYEEQRVESQHDIVQTAEASLWWITGHKRAPHDLGVGQFLHEADLAKGVAGHAVILTGNEIESRDRRKEGPSCPQPTRLAPC